MIEKEKNEIFDELLKYINRVKELEKQLRFYKDKAIRIFNEHKCTEAISEYMNKNHDSGLYEEIWALIWDYKGVYWHIKEFEDKLKQIKKAYEDWAFESYDDTTETFMVRMEKLLGIGFETDKKVLEGDKQ